MNTELKKLRRIIKTRDAHIKRLLEINDELEEKVECAERVRVMAINHLSENVKASMDVLMSKELVAMDYEEE